ncbi:hypothetical protein [Flavihumibacter sp. ZG627]|nr:hypothetical protein [Flavihumibacter sp. ZG627]
MRCIFFLAAVLLFNSLLAQDKDGRQVIYPGVTRADGTLWLKYIKLRS